MRVRTYAMVTLAFAVSMAAARAADPRYPDWPCTQAKVPEISVAAIWAGPALDDAESKWKDDSRVSALVSKLAARKEDPRQHGQACHDQRRRQAGQTGYRAPER